MAVFFILCGFLDVLSFSAVPIAKGSRTNKVLSGNYPPILQKKGIGISYIPTPFFLVLTNICQLKTACTLWRMNFWWISSWRGAEKWELLGLSARRKAQKFIVIWLMSLAFFGYPGDVRSKRLLHQTDQPVFILGLVNGLFIIKCRMQSAECRVKRVRSKDLARFYFKLGRREP